jgi:outer membrane protein assembly factor BamA
LLFCFFFLLIIAAQNADTMYFVVKQVNITGNKKTKSTIILRELDLVEGDSIKNPDLDKRLDLNVEN